MKNKSGQTLIEVAIAIGIASMVIVALVVLAGNSLRNAQETIRRSESTKIANAGIEAVIYYKNISGFGNTTFPQSDGETICYEMSATVAGTIISPVNCQDAFKTVVAPGSNLEYTRKIQAYKKNSSTLEIASTVNWEVLGGAGAINSVTVPRIITNWK